MKKYRYTGSEPVDLPTLGRADVTPGTHVEVEPPASLDDNPDFEHIPDPKRSAAAKKAAAANTDEES